MIAAGALGSAQVRYAMAPSPAAAVCPRNARSSSNNSSRCSISLSPGDAARAERFWVDLQLDHASGIESSSKLLVGELPQKLVEPAHLAGGQRANRAVAEVLVTEIFAAAREITGWFVPFPCRSGEQVVEGVPGLVEIDVRLTRPGSVGSGGTASGSIPLTVIGESLSNQPRTPLGRTSRSGGAHSSPSMNAGSSDGFARKRAISASDARTSPPVTPISSASPRVARPESGPALRHRRLTVSLVKLGTTRAAQRLIILEEAFDRFVVFIGKS